MGQPSSKDEMTIRHQFDRLCQMALKGEAVNYYKHMMQNYVCLII